jgi:quercetin dioxygenase-like cupin family protein
MQFTYPHTIENTTGEKIIFKGLEGDRLIVENEVHPQQGPPMHTHFKQDEALTVVSGRMGYQVAGEEPKLVGPGETVLFKRGIPHKFWNAGTDTLKCTGWVQPANTIEFFLTALYQAQVKSGSSKPDAFDGAYLLTRYKREYDMNEIPGFVKKTVIPMTYFIGKLLGKYKHFKDAPEPLK